MIAQPYHLYVERTDPTRNMARFYAMSIEPTLFGDVCLTRRWGRIGAQGQVMRHSFQREEDAVDVFLDLLRQKRGRGYRPRHSTLAEQVHCKPAPNLQERQYRSDEECDQMFAQAGVVGEGGK